MAGTGLSRDNIGFQARAVVDIEDLNLFAGKNAGGTDDVLINGDAALIIKFSRGHPGIGDLGFTQRQEHIRSVPSVFRAGALSEERPPSGPRPDHF